MCAGVTDEAGTTNPAETRPSEPLMSSSDTAGVLQDVVAGQKMRAITDMWDSLIIPPMSDGPDDEVYPRYVQTLKDIITDLAKTSNQFEGAAQALAEANVRQTKIITKLRADVVRLKLKMAGIE